VNPHRIDTHTHVVPPFYERWLREHPRYRGPYVPWSPATAIEHFDRLGIATGILSVSTPGSRIDAGDEPAATRELARRLNDYTADVVRAAPDRYGFFATLPLPDVDHALAEAAYALDELHADGVVLMTNTDGVYLGDPRWDPLLDYLDGRGAVVFAHPTGHTTPGLDGVSAGVIDFLADTVRAAVNLARHDCPRRYPRIRFLLAHGGGYLPYAALRIARMALPGLPRDEALGVLRRFGFDTALTAGPYALPSLLAFAAGDHVTYGSDWPYCPIDDAIAFTERLDAYPIGGDLAYSINRGNAERLFPRLNRSLSS
jgi:predicted TIM-barrel fold metal-dependent hydrolase